MCLLQKASSGFDIYKRELSQGHFVSRSRRVKKNFTNHCGAFTTLSTKSIFCPKSKTLYTDEFPSVTNTERTIVESIVDHPIRSRAHKRSPQPTTSHVPRKKPKDFNQAKAARPSSEKTRLCLSAKDSINFYRVATLSLRGIDYFPRVGDRREIEKFPPDAATPATTIKTSINLV